MSDIFLSSKVWITAALCESWQQLYIYPVNIVSCLLDHILDSPDGFCHVGAGRHFPAESLNSSDFVFQRRKSCAQVLHWNRNRKKKQKTQQIKL